MDAAMLGDPRKERGLLARASWYLRASHLLMWGLMVAVLGTYELLIDRFPASPWRGAMGFAFWLSQLWLLWALWPGTPTEITGKPYRGEGEVLVYALSSGFFIWQRDHIWVVLAWSIVSALFFLRIAVFRRKPSTIAAIGWILSGVVALFVEWPNGQKFFLVVLLGGLSTVFQGVVEFARTVKANQRPSPPTSSLRQGSS